jgi:hypothetical protein
VSERHQQNLNILAAAAGLSLAEFERHLVEMTPHTRNGRAVAAAIFCRAQDYWPNFFDLDDRSALATWAQMFDDYCPFLTPEVAVRVVDALAAAGAPMPEVGEFLQSAERIMEADSE